MVLSRWRSRLVQLLRISVGIALALLFSCQRSSSLPAEVTGGEPTLLSSHHSAVLMYDQDTLSFWQDTYRRSSQRLLDEALLPVLTSEERQTVRGVRLSLPISQAPQGFASQYPPPEIILPIASLKFLDDLCIAYAWLWANNYSLEPIEDYVAMLRYKPLAEFGDRYPTPLEALGIPANAIDDEAVDSLSIKFFNSARAFILAHELAHIRFQHQGSAVDREIQADAFALDMMARLDTLPMGTILYFQSLVHFSPNQAGFRSEAEWETFLQNEQTHPLNGDRIQAMAEFLSHHAADFVAADDPNGGDTIALAQFIGQSLYPLADYLNDPELQHCRWNCFY